MRPGTQVRKHASKGAVPSSRDAYDLVALAHKGFDDADLGRHLGATDNGSERALGHVNSAAEVIELLLEEEARDRGREELGDAGSGGVGAAGDRRRAMTCKRQWYVLRLVSNEARACIDTLRQWCQLTSRCSALAS